MKKLILALLVAALCIAVPASAALNWTDLPTSDDILIDSIYRPAPGGTYFDVTLLGYDETYHGWCGFAGTSAIIDDPYSACLTKPTGEEWNKINWVLNHKGTHSYEEIQAAIWIIRGSPVLFWNTPEARAFAAAADPNYQVCPNGGFGAVLVEDCNGEGQPVIIEIPCPGDTPVVPEFPTMMIPVFLVGSILVAASVLKKE